VTRVTNLSGEHKLVAEVPREEFGSAWLSHVCDPDPRYARGTVSSIYYDTLCLASYEEKVNGDFLKSKVRLRWYDTPERPESGHADAFLELKVRAGSGRHKTRSSLRLSREWLRDVELDDEGLRSLLDRHRADLMATMRADVYPVVAVTYDRCRFVCPVSGARVSLDANIRVTKVNPALLVSVCAPRIGAVVIEIKDAQLDEVPWLGPLHRAGFASRSFSKYGECMAKIMQGTML